ncbi:MAG: YjbE family putative metal transport protein [Candidatus Puniceispirillum sp.]
MSLAMIADILQIIFADIILSGDNALVIGMAAAGLAPELRRRAIFIGMMMAAGMRIIFAVLASYLLAFEGILLIGGLLLAWVCWRFYNDLREFNEAPEAVETADGETESTGDNQNASFGRALFTILVADVSMSIDNVVAVAAIARDNTMLLVFGLALAIAFMALFASMIMRVMLRFRWLSYLGLFFLIYLTAMMLYDGARELNLLAIFI